MFFKLIFLVFLSWFFLMIFCWVEISNVCSFFTFTIFVVFKKGVACLTLCFLAAYQVRWKNKWKNNLFFASLVRTFCGRVLVFRFWENEKIVVCHRSLKLMLAFLIIIVGNLLHNLHFFHTDFIMFHIFFFGWGIFSVCIFLFFGSFFVGCVSRRYFSIFLVLFIFFCFSQIFGSHWIQSCKKEFCAFFWIFFFRI